MLRITPKVYCSLRSINNYSRTTLWWHRFTGPSFVAPNFSKELPCKSFKHSYPPLRSGDDIDSVAALYRFKYSPNLRSLQNKMDASLLLPPASVRGMTVLDREAFVKKVAVPHVKVKSENVQSALKCLKKLMLKMEKVKPVQTDTEDQDKKVVLLNPLLVKSIDDFKEEYDKIASGGEVEFLDKEVTLCYENWKADDIIKAILPENQEGAQGYSMIGHIIHLNLREHVLPYKTTIGEVLLEKIPNITLVVNKTNIIDTTYRNFQMETLAGTGETDVTVKENGCSFSFDFAKVYWNPRLSTEHERIVKKLHHEDVLYDVMAGVGPFAIPAGKKKCKVLANDLNPHSYEALVRNCASNKTKERVTCHNLDGHDFIKTVLKESLLKTWRNSYFCGKIHITMNLPAMAVEFLPSFIGIFSKGDNVPENVTLPLVHVYMFIKDTSEDTAIALVAEKLGYKKIDDLANSENTGSSNGIDPDTKSEKAKSNSDFGGLRKHVDEVVHVRAVSPNKNMMRVSFRLPLDILTDGSSHTQEPPSKKLKES